MSEGKVTLTCGHSNRPSVCVWEPDIDRHSHRCRSYSAYCPACAEEATLAMVDYIEALEAEVATALSIIAKEEAKVKKLRKENAELRTIARRHNEVVGDKINLRAENAELKAKVDLLRAALKPFADEALWWSERGDLSLRTPEDGFEDLANTATGVDPTLHAANVLAQTSAKEGEE